MKVEQLTARERAVYEDYLHAGNQNFWSDRARAISVAQTGGMSISDYEYAGYSGAQTEVPGWYISAGDIE